jgi:hypothetical protein
VFTVYLPNQYGGRLKIEHITTQLRLGSTRLIMSLWHNPRVANICM